MFNFDFSARGFSGWSDWVLRPKVRPLSGMNWPMVDGSWGCFKNTTSWKSTTSWRAFVQKWLKIVPKCFLVNFLLWWTVFTMYPRKPMKSRVVCPPFGWQFLACPVCQTALRRVPWISTTVIAQKLVGSKKSSHGQETIYETASKLNP